MLDDFRLLKPSAFSEIICSSCVLGKYAKKIQSQKSLNFVPRIFFIEPTENQLLKSRDRKYDVRCSGGRGFLCLIHSDGFCHWFKHAAEQDLHRRLQLHLTTVQNQTYFQNWFIILIINSKLHTLASVRSQLQRMFYLIKTPESSIFSKL